MNKVVPVRLIKNWINEAKEQDIDHVGEYVEKKILDFDNKTITKEVQK